MYGNLFTLSICNLGCRCDLDRYATYRSDQCIGCLHDTQRKSVQRTARLALAAALVEIGQLFLAIHFGRLLSDALNNDYVKYAVAVAFLGVGTLFLIKKNKATKPDKEITDKKSHPFFRGLLVAVLNPQALPFWLFVLAFMQSMTFFSIDTLAQLDFLLVFLLSAAIGKWFALALYGYLSALIAGRLKTITKFINKIIGVVFLVLGMVQLIKILT